MLTERERKRIRAGLLREIDHMLEVHRTIKVRRIYRKMDRETIEQSHSTLCRMVGRLARVRDQLASEYPLGTGGLADHLHEAIRHIHNVEATLWQKK